MDTTSKHHPISGHKNARAMRGVALFHERGDEIAETAEGSYRVPDSDGAEYVVVLERGYCSCPDRAETCKHLFAATIYAAKKNAGCRRQRTGGAAGAPQRRHGERTERPTEDRRDAARPSDTPRRRGGSCGLGPAQVRANIAKMEG